jgi:hypothetical protein
MDPAAWWGLGETIPRRGLYIGPGPRRPCESNSSRPPIPKLQNLSSGRPVISICRLKLCRAEQTPQKQTVKWNIPSEGPLVSIFYLFYLFALLLHRTNHHCTAAATRPVRPSAALPRPPAAAPPPLAHCRTAAASRRSPARARPAPLARPPPKSRMEPAPPIPAC